MIYGGSGFGRNWRFGHFVAMGVLVFLSLILVFPFDMTLKLLNVSLTLEKFQAPRDLELF